MKLLNKVNEIFENYKWEKYIDNPYKLDRKSETYKEKYNSEKSDHYFIKKYCERIGKGHYGFSLGNPIHPEWTEIIDQVLELCIENDPDFEIQQIKIKWGTVNFNVSSEVIEDIHEIDKKFYELSDEALVY